MQFSANHLLDRALVAYSYLPHHPGKGAIYERAMRLVEPTWDKPRFRTRFGVRFECDLADKLMREIYYVGFDRRDYLVLRRLVKPGNVVFDVGANIGYFSLLFAKWLRGTGTVHAFEPFPDTIRRFQRNFDLNPGFKSVVCLHKLAVFDFVGSMSMAVPDEGNSGCNYLIGEKSGEIEVTTLDDFVQQGRLSRLDLIKIDVEGAEVGLLQGAEQTINSFRPILMIEINHSTLKRFGKTPADVVTLLGKYRYRMSYATRFGTLKPLSRLPVQGEEPNIFAFPID